MNLFKKALIGVGASVAMMAAATAAPINVGGVNWDPDYVDAGDFDFIGEFKFTQWYTSTVSTKATGITTTNFDSAVGIGAVLTDPGAGYYLQGVGEFDRINGGFSSGPAFMDPGKELTYAFGGIKLNADNTFDLSQAWASVFVNSTTPNYSTPAGSGDEVLDAQSGLLWLDLELAALAFESGTVGNGVVSGIFNVIGGAAAGNFVPSTISYTADASFFRNGVPLAYSTGGNGSVLANTIPEPGSLALAGLALLGLGAARRRKSAK